MCEVLAALWKHQSSVNRIVLLSSIIFLYLADEREPYSVQTVKPPPIPPTVSGTANSPRNSPRLMSSFGKRLPAAEQSLTTPNANYNGARTSPTQLSSLRSSSSDQLLRYVDLLTNKT